MNTTHYAQGTFSVDFNKWLFATVFSVAISVFLTLLVSSLFNLSAPSTGVVLWLTTSVFNSLAQVRVINSAFHVQLSRWFPLLLIGSLVGWMISFLLAYSLVRMTEFSIESTGNAVWIGFFGGGIIGLFPGIFIGLAYWWLILPDDNAKRLLVSNVLGWCLGMGLASAGILLLLTIIVGNMFTVF